jgi:hypothetical protein
MRSEQFSGLFRTRTELALVATALYAFLVLLALYAPIDPKAPFVLLLGSQETTREAARTFVQSLFWPFVGVLAITAGQGLVEYRRKRL